MMIEADRMLIYQEFFLIICKSNDVIETCVCCVM